ncbi:MAG: hypothetical protein K5866_09210 [Treponema sp.]|nr:hypothetical protein [Treponema sp.]
MIFTLIVLLLVIVFFAFFIGMNLSNICQSFWFFKTYTNIPVAVLVLIAFAAGIVISILVFLVAKLKSSAKEDRNRQVIVEKEKISKREEKIKKNLEKLKKKKSADKKDSQLSDDNKDTEDSAKTQVNEVKQDSQVKEDKEKK